MDLSFCLNVKTVLLGLVDKKQLEIIFLLAKQYIFKALVNDTPATFTTFQIFFKQNMRNNNIWQLSPLPTKNLRIVGVCFLFLPGASEVFLLPTRTFSTSLS